MDNEKPAYLTTLTSLRGIAAVFVVMHHSSLYFGSFIPFVHTDFFENAWIWVDFFFILSGFIMAYSYGRYFRDRVTFKAYKKFIAARFARIYPLHLITLLWAFAVVVAIVYMSASVDAVIGDLLRPGALLPCVLLIQDLHLYKVSPLNFPAWSLSTEWWMYVIFPFLVPYFSGLTKTKRLCSLLVIIAAFFAIRYGLGPISGTSPDGKPKINMIADFGMLRCAASFCAGMLLFEFYTTRFAFSLLKSSWSFILFFAATLFAIHAGITDILIIGLFPFVLLTAAYNQTAVKKILSGSVFQKLGDWSFSIYMVHGPIILMMMCYSVYKDPNLLSKLTSSAGSSTNPDYKIGLLYCCTLLALTLAVASFTHRFIELPARIYLKNALGSEKNGFEIKRLINRSFLKSARKGRIPIQLRTLGEDYNN